MKSKVRRWVEKYYREPKRRVPVYIGSGEVFMFPSRSDPMGRMHIVARTSRRTPKGKELTEFACSCEAFFHNIDDDCPHVFNLKIQLTEAKKKALKKGGKK